MGEVAPPSESGPPVEFRTRVARRASVEDLSRLYHDGYHRFVRLAEAITRDPEEACDAVQEGFSNALQSLNRYEARGSFEAWVWQCVLNAARMSRRKSVRRALTRRHDPGAKPTQPAEAHSKLLEQVASLPERQRLVLFLRYFADLPYDGIAEALEISPGTVAATLHAARYALRQQFEEAEDG